jgi:hypothetical protein
MNKNTIEKWQRLIHRGGEIMKTAITNLKITKTQGWMILFLTLCVILTSMSCDKGNSQKQMKCGQVQSPRISIISEDGKKYLYMTDFHNWIILFENINKLEMDDCIDPIDFEMDIVHNIKILINTSSLYDYSFETVPIKLEIVSNQADADSKKGKIFLENKKYYIYVIPMVHPGPVYSITYDGQDIHVEN